MNQHFYLKQLTSEAFYNKIEKLQIIIFCPNIHCGRSGQCWSRCMNLLSHGKSAMTPEKEGREFSNPIGWLVQEVTDRSEHQQQLTLNIVSS